MRFRGSAVVVATCLVLACAPSALVASGSGDVREIELTDGTILRAEIVSLHDGVFRVRSPSLGEIDVPQSRVRTIVAPGRSSPPPAARASSAPLAGQGADPAAADAQRAAVDSLAQDPVLREQALSLQDDPTVRAILSDAALMDAIRAGDLGTIANDPKIQELMRKPAVRALTERHTHSSPRHAAEP